MAIVCRHSAEAQPVMGNLIGVFGDARLSPTRKQNVKNRLQIGLRAHSFYTSSLPKLDIKVLLALIPSHSSVVPTLNIESDQPNWDNLGKRDKIKPLRSINSIFREHSSDMWKGVRLRIMSHWVWCCFFATPALG